jgi:hypothetical protein
MDVVRYTYDRRTAGHEDQRVDSWSIVDANFKVGLLNDLDLQVVVPTYEWVEIDDHARGVTSRRRGFGDLTLRLKQNLWGNDGGATAFAVLPFVKLPTNQDGLGNDAVEGGLALPLAVALPRGWDMGLMAEFDALEDEDAAGYHVDFLDSITFNHGIVGALAGFMEFVSIATTERERRWVGLVDLGLIYAVTEDLHVDAGVNLGLPRPDHYVSTFFGLSQRY